MLAAEIRRKIGRNQIMTFVCFFFVFLVYSHLIASSVLLCLLLRERKVTEKGLRILNCQANLTT